MSIYKGSIYMPFHRLSFSLTKILATPQLKGPLRTTHQTIYKRYGPLYLTVLRLSLLSSF